MKYKIYLLFITFLFTITFLSACSEKNIPDEPPEIKVTSNTIEIEYVVGLNIWNGIIDRFDNFDYYMRDREIGDLPYIETGSKITIEFIGDVPHNDIVIYDYILNSDGTEKFNVSPVEIPVKFKNNIAEFVLDTNIATLFSSGWELFVQGGFIRGFKMNCSWGDSESGNYKDCEYAFIIRSD